MQVAWGCSFIVRMYLSFQGVVSGCRGCLWLCLVVYRGFGQLGGGMCSVWMCGCEVYFEIGFFWMGFIYNRLCKQASASVSQCQCKQASASASQCRVPVQANRYYFQMQNNQSYVHQTSPLEWGTWPPCAQPGVTLNAFTSVATGTTPYRQLLDIQ